jgi:hypothetical protein
MIRLRLYGGIGCGNRPILFPLTMRETPWYAPANVRPEEGLPMKAKVVLAWILASTFVVAGAAGATAPPAKGYSSSLTANTDPGSTATAMITKASKVQIKPATGSVCFTIKLKGVTDLSSAPITNTGNTLTVQVAVNNVTHNKDLTFDLGNGSIVSSTAKQCISNGDSGTWGSALSAGTPIEIRRISATLNGDSDPFAVAGVTTK